MRNAVNFMLAGQISDGIVTTIGAFARGIHHEVNPLAKYLYSLYPANLIILKLFVGLFIAYLFLQSMKLFNYFNPALKKKWNKRYSYTLYFGGVMGFFGAFSWIAGT